MDILEKTGEFVRPGRSADIECRPVFAVTGMLVGLHADGFGDLGPAVHFIDVHLCELIRRIADGIEALADQQFLCIRRVDRFGDFLLDACSQ